MMCRCSRSRSQNTKNRDKNTLIRKKFTYLHPYAFFSYRKSSFTGVIFSYRRLPANDGPQHCSCLGHFRSPRSPVKLHLSRGFLSEPLSHTPSCDKSEVHGSQDASKSRSLVVSDSYYVSYQTLTVVL